MVMDTYVPYKGEKMIDELRKELVKALDAKVKYGDREEPEWDHLMGVILEGADWLDEKDGFGPSARWFRDDGEELHWFLAKVLRAVYYLGHDAALAEIQNDISYDRNNTRKYLTEHWLRKDPNGSE
jgi:hypothetical protein